MHYVTQDVLFFVEFLKIFSFPFDDERIATFVLHVGIIIVLH